jgi:hypothetical protein
MKRVAAVAITSLLVAGGCFFPSFGGFSDFGNIDDPGPFPTVLATYAHGTASMEVTQGGVTQTIALNEVGRGSSLNSFIGSSVSWRNEDGWSLTVTSYEVGNPFAPEPSNDAEQSHDEQYSAEISVGLIDGHEYWRADGYGVAGNRCIVDVTELDKTDVSGSATCRGLRWADGTVSPVSIEPVLIEGQEPFDAEITFEATP